MLHNVYLWLFIASVMASCDHLHQPKDHPISASAEKIMPQNGFIWSLIQEENPWKKNYNFHMFEFQDSLWILQNSQTFVSADGVHWRESKHFNPIGNQAFLDIIIHQGQVIGLGHFTGNSESFQFKQSVHFTKDMHSWSAVPFVPTLPIRYFNHPFSFNGKLWIIGGEFKEETFGDVWNSTDGLYWEKVASSTAMGPRSGGQIVLKNDTLFYLDHQVWISANGTDWTLHKASIADGANIFGYSALVFDNKIWLLGCNRNTSFTNAVWYSHNGKDWQQMQAPWSPRGGVAAAVFKNKIFLTGGKYGGTPDKTEFVYSNDLWTMSKG